MSEIKRVCVVAGGAGFIGTNLVKKLIEAGAKVVVGDNFSLGSPKNLNNLVSENFSDLLNVDLSTTEGSSLLYEHAKNKYGKIDEIWHLAANSDIPSGVEDPNVDLKDTFMTTFELLKVAKNYSVKKFNFASSSAVYGNWGEASLNETLGPLRPISNYGAMKLASEAQICAAAEDFLEEANIFRFPNVVGMPATHGVILDFVNKLKESPNFLDVLGNGMQKKSYLHVSELVDGMLYVASMPKRHNKVEVVNIGCSDAGILVKDIANIVRNLVAPSATIRYGTSDRGWLGDVPRFSYNTEYLEKLGWQPKMSSHSAVLLAANEISIRLNPNEN